MSLIVFLLILILIIGVVFSIAYYTPWPAPLSWMRWVLPLIALIVVLVVLLQKLGVA